MAKKRQPQTSQNANEQAVTLRDRIGKDALEKLKEASRTMREEEEKRQAAEREKKIAEQKAREKNKSFAELFEESTLDWRKFK
jgi:spore cortex formation protein SpoVR/YcgB (stage V sporulation)